MSAAACTRVTRRVVGAAGLAVALLLAGAGAAAQQPPTVVDLPTRSGVTLRMWVAEPAQAPPSGVAVLLTGGTGRLGLFPNGSMRFEGNFLVRSRGLFLERNIAVVLPDVPSDRSGGLDGDFRDSAAHAADMGAVVAWARARFGQPVWLVGTSRGTHSAAQGALQATGPAAPDGIVLTATVLARSRFASSTARPVQEYDFSALAVPALVLHHEQDPCDVCPPALLPQLMARLPAGRSELKTYTGGTSRGAGCDPFTHHGFAGIEDQVVGDIANWMQARK